MPQTCNTPRGEDMQLYTPNKSLRAKMSHIILNQPPGAEGRRGGQGIDGATAKGGRPKGSSSSNWILMSCQPHRVTSGQSNSGHKQIHISKLFSRIYQPSVKSIYKTNHFANIKHTHTNIRHKFSKS